MAWCGWTPLPIELKAVTRAYFEKITTITKGETAKESKAVLQPPMDTAWVSKLAHVVRAKVELRRRFLMAGWGASGEAWS